MPGAGGDGGYYAYQGLGHEHADGARGGGGVGYGGGEEDEGEDEQKNPRHRGGRARVRCIDALRGLSIAVYVCICSLVFSPHSIHITQIQGLIRVVCSVVYLLCVFLKNGVGEHATGTERV